MSRRSVLAVAAVLFCVLGMAALILSITMPASARPHPLPVIDPPAPRFAALTADLPDQLPPQVRAAIDAARDVPHSPQAVPDVGLYKWTPGNQAHPGGVVVYSFYYANFGDADAANVIITDVLPAQTTYAGDTSGLPLTTGGGVITWTVGALPARSYGAFNLSLNVDPGASTGSTLADNCAYISTTTSGGDLGNDQGCAGGVNLVSDSVEIAVQTWPGGLFDAAPGQEAPFTLQVCNFNGTSAGPVRITDTLPLSTTFSRWQTTGFWPPLWRQISVVGNQVVLEAPGLPANVCDNVQLFALVNAAAPQGMPLLNQLHGYTPGDTDPNNNDARNDAVHVRVTRVDLSTHRRVSWGTFGFEVDLANSGNTAVPALLTDTLPLSATYRSGSGELTVWGGINSRTFVTPTVIDAHTIVWNLGTLPVGFNGQLHYNLDVAPGASGPLENCGTIAANVPDDTPWDNMACATTSFLSPGPILYVAQQHEWRNNYNQVRYELIAINAGDQVLTNVWLTDTYPLSTTMEGGYDVSALSWVTDTWDAPSQQRIFWIEQLQPGETARIWVNLNLDAPFDRPHTYTNTVDYEAIGGPATSTHEATLGDFTNIELRLDSSNIDMWGNASPGVDVRVTAANTVLTTTVGRPWDATAWDFYQPGAINAGDTVTVEVVGSLADPIVLHIPTPFNVAANSSTRRVYGQIDALDEAVIGISVYGYLDTTALTDNTGHFTRTLPMMERGQQGEVIDRVTDDALTVSYHANFTSPDLLLIVNASDDWIEINYEVGHTLWFTVTDAVGNVKATLTDVTQVVPWWGGPNNTGYSTNLNSATWLPGRPDIQAGDWVYGALDNGFTSAVRIGTITGSIDQPSATVAGTFDIPWLNATLNGGCWIDGVDGRIDFTAASNGGAYTCNFSPQVLHPGDSIEVEYEDLSRDRVRYTFRLPGPDVGINHWTQGQPAAGSRFEYWLEYRNDGDLAATDVILTDTLPAEVTYVSDGAAVAPTINGQQVSWSLGALPPHSWRRIPVVVDVAGGTADGTLLHNEVVVTDPNDRNPGNDSQGRDDAVAALNVDLYVGLGNQGDQPAPGNDYVYRIDYGNQASTGSGPVVLTQTLPVSSTYVSFWSEDPLWSLASNAGNQVVFTRPVINGQTGWQLFVRLHLDATATNGTQLNTHVDIGTSNETGPLDNNSTSFTMFVQDPRLDVALDNQFESGITVPDHKVTFRMTYHNWGNVAGQSTRITGTLPANTTFVTSTRQVFAYNQWQNEPFAPLLTNGQQLVWDLSTLPTGTDGNLRVTLQIDPATPIGTVLTYTARIGSDGVDNDDRNDQASDSIVVRGAGPNVMVRKSGHWQGDDRIRYDLQFFNVGTTMLTGATLTDTYPVSTTLSGYGEFWSSTSTHNAGARQVVWTMPDQINPGDSGGNWLEVTVDPAMAKGRWLTNTLDIRQPIGEIMPADNHAYAVVTTGPDLYVSKSAERATVKPNDLITFTLTFGNQAQRGADSMVGRVRLYDTLPNGLTFVGATWHDCPICTVEPLLVNGQQVIFDFDPQGSGWWNRLDVTAQVTTTAQGGDVFVNTASINSNNAADVDPVAGNNSASAQVVLTNPRFEVSKVRSGNGVAGTTITYTVSVSNTGNLTGTNVSAIDVVPSGVTYGGGGVFGGGQVSWTLASIAPGLNVPIGWFTGTLTCAANTTINNQQYRVTASDQAITSTNGAAVSFTTITPTINAAFSNSPATLIGGGAVTFTGTASTNGTPLAYEWSFGDGTTSTGLTASHTYTQPGTYTATLTATDGCGFAQMAVVSNAVIVYTPVHAAFTAAPTTGTPPLTVVFTNTSTGDFTSSLWAFGDGGTSTLPDPTHVYSAVGTYTVTLTINGPGGRDAVTTAHAITVQNYRVMLPLVRRS